jgi:hypothetical protein
VYFRNNLCGFWSRLLLRKNFPPCSRAVRHRSNLAFVDSLLLAGSTHDWRHLSQSPYAQRPLAVSTHVLQQQHEGPGAAATACSKRPEFSIDLLLPCARSGNWFCLLSLLINLLCASAEVPDMWVRVQSIHGQQHHKVCNSYSGRQIALCVVCSKFTLLPKYRVQAWHEVTGLVQALQRTWLLSVCPGALL